MSLNECLSLHVNFDLLLFTCHSCHVPIDLSLSSCHSQHVNIYISLLTCHSKRKLKLLGCITSFWHERAAFQRSAFGRSTDGNDVVVTIHISLFSGVLGSKNLLAKVAKNTQKPGRPFWILKALQAGSKCPFAARQSGHS